MKKFCLLIIVLLISTNCDFSPPLYREILNAQEYISLQQYKKAITQYEKILKGNPQKDIRVKIYYQLGELYSIQFTEYNKAIKYYELVKQVTENPLWLVKTEERMGEINFSYAKNFKKSALNYKRLFEFIPKLKRSDFYQFRLSLSHLNMEDLDETIKGFKEIKENNKHKYYVKSFYYLGVAHFQKKEWEKAIKFWSEYIKREKRKDSIVQTKFLMANAYETMEKLKKAYNLYYSILGEYPNTEVLKNRLNSIYARRVARKR